MAYTDRSPIIMQGKVFIAERQFDGPLTSGWDWVGNADNASLSFKQKREPIKDNFTGKGLTRAAPVVETELEFMLSMLDISSLSLARASWGTWGGTEVAGSVAAEEITLYNDSYVMLEYTNIDVDSIVIAGATVDVDYTVNVIDAAAGRVKVLAASAAAPAGTPFETTIAYDYAANNGKVEGFTTGQAFYSIEVQGINVAQSNQPFKLRIHQVQLDAFKKTDWIDKKQMKLETGGEILIDGSIDDAGEFSQVFWTRRG
jgi:hypothetical protein